MDCKYYRRHWDEDRGDEYAVWGTCTYLFAVDGEGWPQRQIEVYDDRTVLFYDPVHFHDQYGGLADQPLDPADTEWSQYEISAEEFEQAWTTLTPLNR